MNKVIGIENSDLRKNKKFVLDSLATKHPGFTLAEGATQRILARVMRSETRPGESCVELVDPPKFKTVDMLQLKRSGFTLAEVLITLGIIGVVAALTIPGLINNYKACRLHSQFLKSYSTVQQAFKQMEADDVSLDPSTYGGRAFYKTFMRYLSAPYVCTSGSNVCASRSVDEYKSYDGNKFFSHVYLDDGQIVLQDGTNIMFENAAFANTIGRIYVSVDLNGYNNPPNRLGYDLFTFQFIDEELKTMGAKGTDYTDMEQYCNPKASNTLNGIACAQKAKENPDYFKDLIREFK